MEDAYSPGQELTLQTQTQELPVILERRKEMLYPEQIMAAEAESVADTLFLPDFPRVRRGDSGVTLEQPGMFQVLYYGDDGSLRSGNTRWEGSVSLPSDAGTQLAGVPMPAMPQAAVGNGQILLKAELPLELTASARQPQTMVTGLMLGENRKPDPTRPSLILRRAGEDSLWEIAKAANSTVRSIQEANGLQSEPVPGQMLLIPIP